MSRSLRSLSIVTRPSNLSRPLARSLYYLPRHNGEVKVQPVRFKIDFQRHAKRLLYQMAIGSAVGYVVLSYLDVEEEDDKANNGAQEDDSVDEEDVQVPETMPEDAFFIPLGRIRQRPHTHYKGSDPEWQSFVEFGNDRQRPAAVRKELVDIICSDTGLTESLQRYIGVPIKPGKVWLDIVIPPGPAPEYERSGLEIAEEYIAWTTRPVPALQVARLQSALMPFPAAKSLWASYSTFCSLQLARFKQFLNIDPASSKTSPHFPVDAVRVRQLPEDSSKQETQTRAQMNKMSDPKPDVSSTKGSAESAASSGSSRIYESLPSLPQPDSDIGFAVTEFKRTLAKTWRPPSAFGERGTFVVRGQLELKGPTGACVLEILADYHPGEASYRTLGVAPKYILPYRQRPRPP